MCNLLSLLGRLYKIKRNNQSKKLDRQQEKATLYDMTDRDVSLSYFVLPGKLYLLVGPRPGTRTYSHRQKWKPGCYFWPLFFPFLPSPAPGPMSRKSLTFVRVIVLGYLAKEETLFFWGLKWTKLSCVQPSQLLLSGIVALAFKIALVPVGCRWMREVRR